VKVSNQIRLSLLFVVRLDLCAIWCHPRLKIDSTSEKIVVDRGTDNEEISQPLHSPQDNICKLSNNPASYLGVLGSRFGPEGGCPD
jgi:hypothetical protein